jgi:hypothetical protein
MVVGLAAGYYLGARAGHDRYLQINRLLRKARDSDAFATALHKVRAVVDLGKERVRSHETEPYVDLTAPVYSAN